MATIDIRTAPKQIREFLEAAAAEVNIELDRRLQIPVKLAATDPERRLREAMRYAVLGGGKRLRPALVLAAARAIDSNADAIAPAAAVEILHAYTLVHDDLPAMDDDEVRRGRPTVHVAFDQATAVLAGDSLLTVALGCLADLGPRCAAALRALVRAAGPGELLGGQMRDLALELRASAVSNTSAGAITIEDAELVHRGKTGALFGVATELGGIAAAASAETIVQLRTYGMAIGVAFQHADDLDDGEFASLREQAAVRRKVLAAEAIDAIKPMGKSGQLLRDLASWIGGI